MRNFFNIKTWNIFPKIISLTVICVLPLACIVIFYSLPEVHNNLMRYKEEKIKNTTEVAYGILDQWNQKYEKGEMTLKQAQEKAYNIIRYLHYGNDDYFWINDFQPKMIMHPNYPIEKKPEWYDENGLVDYKDPYDVYLFVEFVKVCKAHGDGYVNYHWTKPGRENEKPFPKKSYVKTFKPWGWIIGSGIYVDDVEDDINNLLHKILIALGCAIILVVLIGFVFAASITKPIVKGVSFAEMVAKGDLTHQLVIKSQDETGSISRALNTMVDGLRNMMQKVVEASDQVAASSEELSTTSVNLSSASQRQAVSLEQVSSNAQTQASSVEEVTSSMEELNASIKGVYDIAQKVKIGAQSSLQQADNAQKASGDTIQAMQKVEESANKINNIIGVIADIADQTNLLALNASIEAARAGDAGRGFAVVAKEISKLADKSAAATKEIAILISETGKNVVNGSSMVKQLDSAIKEMRKVSEAASQYGQEMANATEEQIAGSKQISEAFQNVNDIAQEIASTVEGLNSLTQQNAMSAEQMASSAQELSNQAENLKIVMSNFKIESMGLHKKQEKITKEVPLNPDHGKDSMEEN